MRFNNIQIVRLVAALGVVSVHLSMYAETVFGADPVVTQWLRLGWVASGLNPLFFAVSGFVLAHVLASGGQSPGRFMIHRMARLYPGYWLALGLVTGVYAAGLWPGAYVTVNGLAIPPAPTLDTWLAIPPSGFRLGQYPLLVEWTLIYEMVLWVGLVGMWLLVGRRRLPVAAAGWLLVLAVKSVVRPDLGSRMIPGWGSVWLSVFVAPFLCGVIAYHLRERGGRARWVVLAAVVGLNALAVQIPLEQVDAHYWPRSLAAGLALWLVVRLPDADRRNPLVVAGGWSYGLYLLHVPLILLACRLMQRTGVLDRTVAGVAVAGLFAVAGGLAFGRLELALHRQVRRGVDWALGRLGTLRTRLRLWPGRRLPFDASRR